MLRYDDMRVDRLLVKEYQAMLEADLKAVVGLNDIDRLLAAFEHVFATYIGVKYAFAVNSGTDALQLALLALGVGKGDRVILPNVTYPADPLAVLYVGATPVFADIKDDLQVDENEIERLCSKKVKAIIAPHMFARPCAIQKIMAIARAHKIPVIEDCCQAESTALGGKRLGSFGEISCFSFSYYKPLSSCGGGGGMLCFNDPVMKTRFEAYTRVWDDQAELLDAGQRFSRMNLLDLSAVKAKWKYLKDIIKSRRMIQALYEQELSAVPGVKLFLDPPDSMCVLQNFPLRYADRAAMAVQLSKNGVICQDPYTPFHMMNIFKAFAKGKYPQSDMYVKHVLQLPLFSFMKKEEALRAAALVQRLSKGMIQTRKGV
ncbi:MAG: aminotransferase class I/II-fold pyridoxal phosphate-dependent enzyme [Candidatus Omnitrophica bacterium]|nr:aminotransferase class I/II-fold pyridoxal phosphate-dependent enzyme [Candidatus Omnitrophota bacterium]